MIIYKINSTSINFLHNIRDWRKLFVMQNHIPTIYRKIGYIKSSHSNKNESPKICISFTWWVSIDNQCIVLMSVQVAITPSWQDYHSMKFFTCLILLWNESLQANIASLSDVSSSLVFDLFHRWLQRLPDNNREITLWYREITLWYTHWIGLR